MLPSWLLKVPIFTKTLVFHERLLCFSKLGKTKKPFVKNERFCENRDLKQPGRQHRGRRRSKVEVIFFFRISLWLHGYVYALTPRLQHNVWDQRWSAAGVSAPSQRKFWWFRVVGEFENLLTTSSTSTGTSLNEELNEQNYGCARVL